MNYSGKIAACDSTFRVTPRGHNTAAGFMPAAFFFDLLNLVRLYRRQHPWNELTYFFGVAPTTTPD
jgi:hypothetical protein